MKHLLPVALLGLAMSMTGCAGGWRGDVAPGAAVPSVAAGQTAAAGGSGGATGDPRAIELVRGLPGALAGAGAYALEGTVHMRNTTSEESSPFRYFRAGDGRERAEVTRPKGQDLLVFDGSTLWAYSPEGGRYASRPWKAGDELTTEVISEIGAAAEAAVSACPPTFAALTRGLLTTEEVHFSVKGPVDVKVAGESRPCDLVEARYDIGSTKLWLDRASGVLLRYELRLSPCSASIPCLAEFVVGKLTLGEPQDASLFAFTPPPGARPVAARVAAGAGPTQGAAGVTFAWKGEGGSVSLAGEFNAWNTSADPLKKQADGSWTITKKLEPGRYMYKFVVDGTNWKEDPTAKETADDGYGGKNAVVVVGGGAVTAAPVAKATPAAAGGTAAGTDGVTFVWKGEGGSVSLAGEFNAWNTSADPLKKQADGSWSLTKKLEPGRYMYKFVVDGTNWKEDPTAKETADDGYGGKNAVVVVGAGAAAAAAPAVKAAAAGADGVTFVWKGEGGSVSLAGEFNAWNTSADPLKKQADGSWTITRNLEPGRYMYKFVVDGTNWKEDPTAKETADDGYGGKNAVVVVGAGSTAAAPAATAAATGPAPAASGKGRAPVQAADGVTFTFGGAARSVSLAGDFNGWALAADPLVKQADGSWTLTKKLAAGAYEYKFLVDGTTWKIDEANPDSKADPYGGRNSVVTVK